MERLNCGPGTTYTENSNYTLYDRLSAIHWGFINPHGDQWIRPILG